MIFDLDDLVAQMSEQSLQAEWREAQSRCPPVSSLHMHVGGVTEILSGRPPWFICWLIALLAELPRGRRLVLTLQITCQLAR